MEHSISEQDNSIDILMSGKLTVTDHEVFRTFLNEDTISGRGTLVLDISAIDFIDSAGIGMLLYANKQAEKKPWKLVIRNPQGQVRKMIELGRLNEVLTVID